MRAKETANDPQGGVVLNPTPGPAFPLGSEPSQTTLHNTEPATGVDLRSDDGRPTDPERAGFVDAGETTTDSGDLPPEDVAQGPTVDLAAGGLLRASSGTSSLSTGPTPSVLALTRQGWCLRSAAAENRASLAAMLKVTAPGQLGRGRDVATHSPAYSALKLVSAWEVVAPERQAVYILQKGKVRRDITALSSTGSIRHIRSKCSERAKLQAPGGGPLSTELNEVWLLHGTKPHHVLPIMREGLNERVTQQAGLFGCGVYLAEDPEKADQYVQPDPGPMSSTNDFESLHAVLYGDPDGEHHPGGDVFYAFAVCALCGVAVRTKDASTDLDWPGVGLFATSERRELREVPGSNPPVRYHSLLAERGAAVKRFREYVFFNSARTHLGFLLSYRRAK